MNQLNNWENYQISEGKNYIKIRHKIKIADIIYEETFTIINDGSFNIENPNELFNLILKKWQKKNQKN